LALTGWRGAIWLPWPEVVANLEASPRPAIILQSPLLFGSTVPLPICPVTSLPVENAPLLRIPLADGATTGLQAPSWAAIDLVQTIRQRRIGERIGNVNGETMLAIDRALMVFLGLA